MVMARKGQEYETIPAGLYQAVCIGVFDLGMQKNYLGNLQYQVRIVFEVNKTDKQGKRYIVSKTYTNSLGTKANLRKDLIGWRGKDFTDQEIESFDLDVLIGKNCMLSIVINDKGYANIQGISGLMETLTPIKIELGIPEKMLAKIKEKQSQAIQEVDSVVDIHDDDVPF